MTAPATDRSAGAGPTPRVSVVLPTLNGEADLRRLLPALAAQVLEPDWHGFEVCAIDSSSTDNTRALLVEFGALVRTIERAEFGHGRSRNVAAADARGEFLVFLSQDAVPVGEHFLEHLLRGFEDPRVAGTYARVVPGAGDDPLTRRTVLELPEASERPVVRDLDGVGGLESLSPAERSDYLRFNNVASAVRASVFREHPFADVPFGEDFAWAAVVLRAGHRIAFTPEAVVEHAHSYGPLAAFERYRTDAAFHREVHGHRVRPGLLSALKGYFYELWRDVVFVLGPRAGERSRVMALLAAPFVRAGQLAGQFAGSHGLGGPRAADFDGFERFG